MQLFAEAIVCATLPHGEHGVIVRLLTDAHGLQAGYVRGGRSRRLRPVLQPGNLVQADLRSRVEEQLAAATVELIKSRAALTLDALAAAALDWATGLTAAALAEGQIYPGLHPALAGLLDAIDSSDDARPWVAGLARYELLLLERLGFGLDLTECAATGTRDDLAYISPKSSKAVSRAAGEPYSAKLLPFPAFLASGGASDWRDILDGLRTTGHFIARDLLAHRRGEELLQARERLTARVAKRAAAAKSAA